MEQLKIYTNLLDQHQEINYNALDKKSKNIYNENIYSLNKVCKIINENLTVATYGLILDMIYKIKENLRIIKSQLSIQS